MRAWEENVIVNIKDLLAGLMFIGIGLFFALNALFYLRIGQPFNMGPGFFPIILGAILIALGSTIALTSLGKPPEAFGRVSWRGLTLVMASILFFALTIRWLGFAPGLGGSVFLAAMSSGRMRVRGALVLSAILTIFCILIFIVALGLPYPVVARWIMT